MQITVEVPWSPKLQTIVEKDTPEGVSVHVPTVIQKRDGFLGAINWVELTIGAGIGVGGNILATWLWEKFFTRRLPPKRITIRQREITVSDKDSLIRIVEQELIEESRES
jgi:hypothetical protein